MRKFVPDHFTCQNGEFDWPALLETQIMRLIPMFNRATILHGGIFQFHQMCQVTIPFQSQLVSLSLKTRHLNHHFSRSGIYSSQVFKHSTKNSHNFRERIKKSTEKSPRFALRPNRRACLAQPVDGWIDAKDFQSQEMQPIPGPCGSSSGFFS